jgi:hypothetical protein
VSELPTNNKPNKDWARAILARHAAGEKVRPISLRFAREALKEPKKEKQ